MNRKVYLTILISVFSIFVLGTFVDLQFSEVMYDESNIVGKAFDVIAGIPTYIIVGYSFYKLSKIFSHKLMVAGLLFLSLGTLAYASLDTIKYVWKTDPYQSVDIFGNGISTIILLIVILMFYCVVVYFIDIKLGDNITENNLYKILLIAIITNVIVLSTKYSFSRPRFYYVNDGHYAYNEWFVMNGFMSNKHMVSFISGHTANAGLILMYKYLLKDKHQKIIFIVFIGWTLMAALARILSGNHYITDVTASVMVVITTIYLSDKWFKLKEN